MSTEIPSTRRSLNRPWISTYDIHNALLNNHLIDLFEVHGTRAGFLRDDSHTAFDPSSDHSLRVRRLSREFGRQVLGAFVRRVGDVGCVSRIAVDGAGEEQGERNRQIMKRREQTRQMMSDRRRLILGGVLGDEERRIWARVPLLIRGDVVAQMLSLMEVEVEAELGEVYVVVGIKRSSVVADGRGVLRRKSLERIQVEMWLWNRLLADTQGVDVGKALVVGLNPGRNKAVAMGAWPAEEGGAGVDGLFDPEVWKLAEVRFGGAECAKGIAALEALAWRVDVVDKGEEWICEAGRDGGLGVQGEGVMQESFLQLVRATRDVRLRPNMKVVSFYDFPWAGAKREVADCVNELTLLSGVSQSMTRESMAMGLPNDFESPSVNAEALKIDRLFTKTLLEMHKPSYQGELVRPATIPHNRFNWRRLQGFKHESPLIFDKQAPEIPHAEQRTFYVDLELASPDMLYTDGGFDVTDGDTLGAAGDLFDEKPVQPMREGSTTDSLIFMIGCGQVIDGEWRHQVFTARSLSREGESAILRECLEHMNTLNSNSFGQPLLNVWGPEQHLLKKAIRSMTAEDAKAVKDIRFYKVVNVLQVVMTGCLAIKGSYKNSVKSVARGLERHGLLEDFKGRKDEDVISNGADAMTVGLSCAEYVYRNKLESLSDAPKMSEIARYNEADCRDIARIVTYLRKHH